MSVKRRPAAENRYVWCFAALLAGALLLCTPLVLVTATADPDNAWLGPDPLTASPSFAGEGWDTVVTVEALPRYDDDALPPAVPLAPSEPDFTAWLSEAIPDLDMLAAASAPDAARPTPNPAQIAALDEALIEESSGAAVTYSPEPEPQPIVQETPSEPMQVAVLDATGAAPDQQLEAEKTPEDVEVSEPDMPADGDDDSTSSIKPLPGSAPDIAPPLPMRRPAAPIKTAEIVVTQETQEKPAPKPAARSMERKEARNDEPRPQRWRPMALAPANADTPAPPKLSPSAPKISQGAYQSQVWSSLARAKPRAGQRGSATVSFTIGANGALRGARIARSSGNAKLDRMALATVRKAAPFAPPPGSGAASYNIRIDFH